MLLAYIAASFVEAEAARETGLRAIEGAHLLAGPPEAPYDEYEEDLDDGDDGGCFVVFQEVTLG